MADIFNYLFDAHQHSRIRRTQQEATNARHRSESVKIDINRLQRDHEKLKLITIALWELLKKQSGLTDQQLKAYIEDVDARDGRRDGRATISTRHTCEQCSHSIPASSLVCAYCGAKQHSEHVF